MTLLLGTRVGRDTAGNIYYRHRALDTKRWVIYNGIVDASKIPAEWHAWLHNMRRNPPRRDSAADDRQWFKPHLANMTGTKMAQIREPYLKKDDAQTKDQAQNLEYQAWKPQDAVTGEQKHTQKGDEDHAG